MTRRTPSIALLALGLLTGCGPSTTTTREQLFDIVFRATTDDGDALGGVALRTGDRLLGVTDSNGALGVSLNAAEGQAVPVTVICPAGFAPPDALPPLRLAHSRLLEHPRQASPISFPATCTRESREVIVLVHAEHGDVLPVLVDGKPVGATDANGVAHVLLEFGRDVRSFEVRLDTTQQHDLKPANPSRTVELTGRDAIVLFEQNLSIAPKFAARKAPPSRHIPYRID